MNLTQWIMRILAIGTGACLILFYALEDTRCLLIAVCLLCVGAIMLNRRVETLEEKISQAGRQKAARTAEAEDEAPKVPKLQVKWGD